ncbi:hypothetical protein QBC34DRAFT_181845 [Podospora aff. communis PSN243]|uniref:Uncharacterized protein n=1 Tax=Podospora aff. communis PSN243 TaxID=3040156 RepID=A0AAV9GBK6_9PEZI|nr:hypothetical protein QBC34DRAFT_181845 [Podospora aff. communis PSN243]
MAASRDPTARLRAGLNPLLTASLGVYHNGQLANNTPLSAVSITSHGAFSSAQTPVSAIQPYNPQEWIGSPIVGPSQDRMPQMQPAQSFGEPQGSPLPPPPYSPPRSNGRPQSMVFEGGHAPSPPAARVAPPPPAPRPAAEHPPANTSFPPPPGGRGASRERRFGLPSLGRRREPEQSGISIEPHPQSPRLGIMQRVLPGHSPPLTLQIPTRTDSDASMPPAARRAASTPAIATPTSARSRSSSQVRWDPMVSVPPPPPGPPPSATRSQSVQRMPSGSDPVMSPPTRRPPPSGVAALGPVPPTPANWQQEDNLPEQPQQRAESPNDSGQQAVDTASNGSSSANPESAASSSSSHLSRHHAVRGDKTLLQRRNESRTRGGGRESMDSSDGSHGLSEIVIPNASGLQRRLTINRGTPRSGRTSEGPRTGESYDSGHMSRGSTPRASASGIGSAQLPPDQLTPTNRSPRSAQKQPEVHHAIAPRALPTPPTGSRSSSGAPRSPTRALTKHLVITQTTDQFARGTVERFTAFAQKEACAASDAERVRLFAEFFVMESRVRRERYGAAIGAMGSEILDLTRDLFRPMPARRESTNSATSGTVDLTPQSSEPRSHRGSTGSGLGNSHGHGSAVSTPSSSVPGSSPTVGPGQSNPNWQSSNYMPSLSPILSMSIGDAPDEEDSRGRPASRWWEADSAGGGSSRLERSKRESKYMGVPKEAREALQWTDDPQSSPAMAGSSSRDSGQEYPPEKVGWHEQEPSCTPEPQRDSMHSASTPTPTTPNPAHLDVSRLVTLPPPYPRHHPAVNNNHPELTQTRNSVRVISDMTEIDILKERFKQGSAKVRSDAAEAAKQRRQALRDNLHSEISSGGIGYAEAAAIEADAKTEEHNKVKELEKKDFDEFQAAVVMPVNEILQARITKATELFDELRGRLFEETRDSNPNMPQEEGDEQPELLEKLTLLKWIFEARETLHRSLYDLLTDRNDRYRDMVLVPYQLVGEEEKVASAKAFFNEDGKKRAAAYADEVLRRTQEFHNVVEETVVRGVEVQLSAFWDIAPDLKRLLDKIPTDMEGFLIQIPASEYGENPCYHDHPLQYLFSLLLHAEKSTYQFIESQTNLLCLLHEVKEAVVSAKAKAMEHEGKDAEQIEDMKKRQASRLSDDLKEKVRVVQDQWVSALGETVEGVKERVGGWLLETGGWDESFEDGGVGGV